MLNGIGNQVGFGYNITSAQLMQKLPEANSALASKPAAPRLIEEDNSKKSSGHPVLWTIGTLAVVGLAGFAAHKGLFKETAKKFVDEKIIDKSKTFYADAKKWVKNLIKTEEKEASKVETPATQAATPPADAPKVETPATQAATPPADAPKLETQTTQTAAAPAEAPKLETQTSAAKSESSKINNFSNTAKTRKEQVELYQKRKLRQAQRETQNKTRIGHPVVKSNIIG